jgi:hypothetical protein
MFLSSGDPLQSTPPGGDPEADGKSPSAFRVALATASFLSAILNLALELCRQLLTFRPQLSI